MKVNNEGRSQFHYIDRRYHEDRVKDRLIQKQLTLSEGDSVILLVRLNYKGPEILSPIIVICIYVQPLANAMPIHRTMFKTQVNTREGNLHIDCEMPTGRGVHFHTQPIFINLYILKYIVIMIAMRAQNKYPIETSYENIHRVQYKCEKISILYVRKIVQLSINNQKLLHLCIYNNIFCFVYRIV